MASDKINYKPLFIDKVIEYSEVLPEYSIGEMLFSVFTQLNKAGIPTETKSDLLNIKDNYFYSALDSSIKEESE
jgi:hypothetical protein